MPAAREPTLSRTDPIGQRAPEVIRILNDAYPGATVALNFSNPLEILIATILSAQCTDVKVNEVTATLFVKYRTPEDYVRVPEDELRADIKPTGFYNQKARVDPRHLRAIDRGLRRAGARHDGGAA